MTTDLKYPIGRAERHESLTSEERVPLIAAIEQAPAQLAAAVAGLSEAQRDTPYRPGGWTVRQVVHHLADSHMNSLMRFKLALTEDTPTIKTYSQERWAQTADAKVAPVEASVAVFGGIHERWVILLRAMTAEDWARKLNHPERGIVTLDENLCIYAWHGRHHVAHITSLREREGWK